MTDIQVRFLGSFIQRIYNVIAIISRMSHSEFLILPSFSGLILYSKHSLLLNERKASS